MNQEQKILKHLIGVGQISEIEAFEYYGVQSLSKVISKLKQKGHRIDCKRDKKIMATLYQYDVEKLPKLNTWPRINMSDDCFRVNDGFAVGEVWL